MSSTTANLPPPASSGPIPAAIDLLKQEVAKTEHPQAASSSSTTSALPSAPSSILIVPAAQYSSAALPQDHTLPSAYPLPTNALVDETSAIHSAGTSGIGAPSTFQSTVGGQLTPGGITPGQELPGGWGATKTATPETTIYEDAAAALKTVGQAAYNAVPTSLVDKFAHASVTDSTSTPISTTTNTLHHENVSATSSSNTTGPIIPESVKNSVTGAVASLPSAAQVKSAVTPSPHTTESVENSVAGASASLPSTAQVKSAVTPSTQTTESVENSVTGAVASLPSAEQVKSAVTPSTQTTESVENSVTGAVASLPSAAQVKSAVTPSPQTTESVKNSVAGAVASLPSAAQVKSAVTPSTQTTESVENSVTGAVASLPSAAQVKSAVTPSTHTIESIKSSIPSTEELPTLEEVKTAVTEEAATLLAQAKSFLGFGSPASPLPTVTHTYPEDSATSPLTGGGGLAATIAPEVAEAAKHSHATSVGDVPLGSSSTDAAVSASSDRTPLAGAKESAAIGGGAAALADVVAAAAKTSTATSVGSTPLADTPQISSSTDRAIHGDEPLTSIGGPVFNPAPELKSTSSAPSTITGSTPLAGAKDSAAVGGGAAAISDDVASAAKDSSATSVGATSLSSEPQISSSADDKVHGAEPLTVIGGPVSHPAPALDFTTKQSDTTPFGLGAPIQTDDLASTLKLPSSDSTLPVSPHDANTPSASKALDSKSPVSPHDVDTPSASKALDSKSPVSPHDVDTPSASKALDSKSPVSPHDADTPSASKALDSVSPKTDTIPSADPGRSTTPVKPTSSNDTSSSSHKKKASFGDKLKGEFKVIAGKLGHDEQKVKEGEALKHGESI